jgi:hypothetical protein
MRPLTPAIKIALAVAGAASYPVLLLFVMGKSFSPFTSESSWGLAAEHSELELEHWSHFIVAIIAAAPIGISSKFALHRGSFFMLLASSVLSALPYAAQLTHIFSANDSWLANYTWQVAAIEVALAPLLVAATIGTLSWLKRRTH